MKKAKLFGILTPVVSVVLALMAVATTRSLATIVVALIVLGLQAVAIYNKMALIMKAKEETAKKAEAKQKAEAKKAEAESRLSFASSVLLMSRCDLSDARVSGDRTAIATAEQAVTDASNAVAVARQALEVASNELAALS